MKNRTRYTLAAILVAFSLSGCDPGVGPDLRDLCPGVPGDQHTLPCPSPEVAVTFTSPITGFKVTQGDTFSCTLSIEKKNVPSDIRIDTIVTFGGSTVNCTSVVANLEPGIYELKARVCAPDYNVCTDATITVVVEPKPDVLVVTTFEGAYPTADCGEIWYGADTAGTSLKRVTSSCGDKRDAQLSSDGQTLIYISNRRLWRSNADGTNPQIYSLIWEDNVLEVTIARISPDGQKIAVAVGVSGWIGIHMFVMNTDGTSLDKVMSKNDSFVGTIQWLPSGELVLGLNLWDEARTSVLGNEYLKYDPSTRSSTHLFSVGTGEWSTARVLGVDPQGDWFALWDYFGSRKIGFVATDGSGLFKTLDRAVWYPFVCSDGTEVCYQPNSRELWSMDLDGQNIRKRLETMGRWIYSVTVWNRP